MHFPGRKTYVSVVEKVHFQKSDISQHVETESGQSFHIARAEFPHRPQDTSGNHHFGVEIRDVFEKVPGAQCFHVFSLAKQWKFVMF